MTKFCLSLNQHPYFVYAAIALVSLRILADSEPSLVDNAISNRVKLLCTGIIVCLFAWSQSTILGAQWLSGRVLDSRPKGHGFEPHRRHCVVVLEQDTFILA